MKRIKNPDKMLRTVFACVGLLVCFAASEAHADLHLIGGGGWSGPRGDSSSYILNGLTGELGLELEMGPNLGLTVGGAYTTFDADAAQLRSDLGLAATDPIDGSTKIIDLTLAPKLYLTNNDIAAFVLLGGGPRWITHRSTAAVTGVQSERSEQAWGAVLGFGLDIAFSEGFRIGFAPSYHRVNAERRPIEYMTFVFYLKI
jgi:hypothetical protein